MRKILYVEWVDSGISLLGNIWQTEEEIKEIVENNQTTETVGILIYENNEWIVLAQTTNDKQARGGYCIYKPNIIRQETLLPCLKEE